MSPSKNPITKYNESEKMIYNVDVNEHNILSKLRSRNDAFNAALHFTNATIKDTMYDCARFKCKRIYTCCSVVCANCI